MAARHTCSLVLGTSSVLIARLDFIYTICQSSRGKHDDLLLEELWRDYDLP